MCLPKKDLHGRASVEFPKVEASAKQRHEVIVLREKAEEEALALKTQLELDIKLKEEEAEKLVELQLSTERDAVLEADNVKKEEKMAAEAVSLQARTAEEEYAKECVKGEEGVRAAVSQLQQR